MSLFADLSSTGLEETNDRLGGFQLLDTDIHTGPIKMMYAGESSSGAKNVTIEIEAGGMTYRETIYITNKKGENWFAHAQDKTKKVPLPGFTTVDNICQVTVGTPLAEVVFEEKVVNRWDSEAKKELPKATMVAVEMLGKVVSLGITKNLENKSVKNESTGVYEPIAESRETNSIDVVFHTESKKTVAEAREGKEEAEFWDKWLKKNKGETRDKRKIKDDSAAGSTTRPGSRAPNSPPQASTAAPARQSLFGKKTAAA